MERKQSKMSDRTRSRNTCLGGPRKFLLVLCEAYAFFGRRVLEWQPLLDPVLIASWIASVSGHLLCFCGHFRSNSCQSMSLDRNRGVFI